MVTMLAWVIETGCLLLLLYYLRAVYIISNAVPNSFNFNKQLIIRKLIKTCFKESVRFRTFIDQKRTDFRSGYFLFVFMDAVAFTNDAKVSWNVARPQQKMMKRRQKGANLIF
ncbi:MAG: hypothetical protein EAZ29_12030 [Runella slithyformis]|nr:MAG: hypothetical protein EAZ29_12030 [Runella slithyformis]